MAMFSQKQAMTAREISSAHGKLTALLAARDHWYDGSVASVDERLSALSNALVSVRNAANSDATLLAEAEKIRAESARLHALRQDLLNRTHSARRSLPRLSSFAGLTERGRQLIATEINEFMADNADAVDDLEELDERAENHADIKTMQLPVTEAASIVAHFRVAANWSARNERSAAPTRTPQKHSMVQDIPDSALFD